MTLLSTSLTLADKKATLIEKSCVNPKDDLDEEKTNIEEKFLFLHEYEHHNPFALHPVKDFCRKKYDDIIERYQGSPDNEVVVSEFGNFSEESVETIMFQVIDKLQSNWESKGLIRKVVSIVIETLQNIRLHGNQDEVGKDSNFIVIGRKKNDYVISVANLVDKNSVEEIKAGLNAIKGCETAELKETYLDVMQGEELSDEGTGGLGILSIAIKSDNNIEYDFEKATEDLTFFNLHITIGGY